LVSPRALPDNYDLEIICLLGHNRELAWVVVLVDEVEDWFLALDPETATLVGSAIDVLDEHGPALGRPLVDRIKGSRLHNLKELRPGSTGSSEIRLLFIFDPRRQAVLLVAGDKAGAWRSWYPTAVKTAERRFAEYLKEIDEQER